VGRNRAQRDVICGILGVRPFGVSDGVKLHAFGGKVRTAVDPGATQLGGDGDLVDLRDQVQSAGIDSLDAELGL
jgi:hypothetical protein